jgi:hypothetical protein
MFIAITEPITTLTDYAITIVALILAGFLLRVGWLNQQTSVCLWGAAFGCVALAAALGGTCHGFIRILGEPLDKVLWQLMIYVLSLASLAMLAGTIFSSVAKRWRRWALLAAAAKTALLWISLIQQPHFDIAAADYSAAMTVVLILQLHSLADASAFWLIAGILVSGVAVVILSSGLTIPQMFSHTDLYHLVQLFGLGLLYQGAKQLEDQ